MATHLSHSLDYLYRPRTVREFFRCGAQFLFGILKLFSFLFQSRPEILYANGIQACLYSVIPARILRIPLVWHVRDSRQYILVESVLAHAASQVVVPDSSLLSEYRNALLVRNSLAASACAGKRKDLGLSRIGFLGQITPRKGVHLAIQAFRQIVEDFPDITLEIAGSAPSAKDELYASELYKQVQADSSLRKRVRFLGYVSTPSKFLRQIDVLLVPSYSEPFGRVALEGMREGCIVIAAEVGGLKMSIRNGSNAFLFYPVNSNSLTLKLREVLSLNTKKIRHVQQMGFTSYSEHEAIAKSDTNQLAKKLQSLNRNKPDIGSPINIAVVIEATCGGTRQHIFDILSRIDIQEFNVTLIYSAERDDSFIIDLECFRRRGIHLKEVRMCREISPTSDAQAFLELMKIFFTSNFDVVHCHSSKAGFLGRVAAKIVGVSAIIYTPHAFAFSYRSFSLRGKLYLALERLASFFTDQFFFVSKSELRDCIKFRVGKKRHRILPPLQNVVDKERLHPTTSKSKIRHLLNIPNCSMVVGMVAHFRPQKGHRYFLEAIPPILERFPSITFLFAGEGPLLDEAMEWVKGRRLCENVIFKGSVDNPADLFSIIDIFVLSSLWEGLPYAILEAMHFSLPIVATRVPGTVDLIRNNSNGLLVQKEDSLGLAKAIIRLLESKDLRSRLGRKAKEDFSSMQEIGSWVSEYQSIYRLVSKRKWR